MKRENFIYFSTVSGFFIGIIFSILKNLNFEEFIYMTLLTTLIFYLISLATISLYIKYVDTKKIVFFNKSELDNVIDMQISEMEKKEDFILDSFDFIRQIEQEELEVIKKNKK